MAKKRINKKPSRGHQYSYAGFMEFLQNNPEVLAIAQEAMSNDNRNTYAAIAPVNRTGKEPAITTNNSIYNRELKDKEYPTFNTQQTATNTEGIPFASTIKKLDDITNTLKESVDINRPLVEQKMGIPKSIWSRYYDAGGTMAAIDGGMSLLSNFAKDAKGLDLRKQKAELNEIANREIAASSNDELLDSYNDVRNLKHVGLHDITGGSYLTDVLGGLGRNAGAFWTGFQTTGNWYAAAAIAAADAASQIFGFGKKKRQVKKFNEDIDWANVRQYANVDNAAKNLAYTNTSSVLDNYMQGMDGPGFYTGAYGGPIHIADSKKGTFTAAATKHGMGVQEFASKVLANKDNYSPAMVKKANFAKNASHWHDYGGNMYNKNDLHNLGVKIGQAINNLSNPGEYEFMNRKVHPNGRVEWYYPSDNYTSWGELPVPHTQRRYDDGGYVNASMSPEERNHAHVLTGEGYLNFNTFEDYKNFMNSYAGGGKLLSDDFTNGVTFVNTGGTHEENPYEGVQMGIAPDGKPNLVEEGEAIYKPFDYVFSNRLKVPKAVREKYKLRGPKDMTFAEAFKSAQKESEERPNDPISKKGLENSATILALSQEALKQKEEENMRKKAKGGHLFAFGIPDNYPTNYIPDNTSTDNKEYLNYNFTSRDRERASDLGFDLDDVDDVKKYLEAINGKTDYASGMERVASNAAVANNRTVTNDTVAAAADDTNPGNGNGDDSDRSRLSPLRYFSTLANAGAVLTDALGLTNRPTVFDKIKGPALVRAPRLGHYLPVMNLDTRYESNVLAQQANATRNALMQGTSPSRAANILAADAIAQSKMGELMRNAEIANYDLAAKRAEYNRDTDKTNAQYNFAAAVENAKNKMANASELLKQAKMNDEAETLAWAAKAQNAKTLAENISNIGREQDAIDYRDMFIKMGPTLPDYMRPKGWSDKEWEDYKKKRQEIYDSSKNITACGGRIKRSKKRGLTY